MQKVLMKLKAYHSSDEIHKELIKRKLNEEKSNIETQINSSISKETIMDHINILENGIKTFIDAISMVTDKENNE